jgi:mRNA interferase MazF
LVLASLTGDDVILCQITSQNVSDSYAIPLTNGDFTEGKLPRSSNIRPNRLFTAESSIILYRAGRLKAGKLKPTKLKVVISKLMDILNS